MNTPRKIELLGGDHAWCIAGLFSADECADLIRFAEGIGFDEAPVTTGAGFLMLPELRNNTRVMVDDTARAEALWARVAPWVPPRIGDFRAVGLNERFRFYRYGPGQYFKWHRDGAFMRADVDEESFLTLMVYLNDDFEGGSTDFRHGDVRVKPERGMVLIFDHGLTHQGAPVVRGAKYVMRTDVMYRRVANRVASGEASLPGLPGRLAAPQGAARPSPSPANDAHDPSVRTRSSQSSKGYRHDPARHPK